MSRLRPVLLVLLLGWGWASPSTAAVPRLLDVHGRLLDARGAALPDDAYTMRFHLYLAAAGGPVWWSSPEAVVSVRDGVYRHLLSLDPAAPAPAAGPVTGPLWLELSVRVDSLWETFPRMELAASPAARASVRADVDSVDGAALLGGSVDRARLAPDAVDGSHVIDGAVGYRERFHEGGFDAGTQACHDLTDPVRGTWQLLCEGQVTVSEPTEVLVIARIERIDFEVVGSAGELVQLETTFELCVGSSGPAVCSVPAGRSREGSSITRSTETTGVGSSNIFAPATLYPGVNQLFLRAAWDHRDATTNPDDVQVNWPVDGLVFQLHYLGRRP